MVQSRWLTKLWLYMYLCIQHGDISLNGWLRGGFLLQTTSIRGNLVTAEQAESVHCSYCSWSCSCLVDDVAMTEVLARRLQPEEIASIQVRKHLPPFFYLMTILEPTTTNNKLEFWNNIQSDSTDLPDPLKWSDKYCIIIVGVEFKIALFDLS